MERSIDQNAILELLREASGDISATFAEPPIALMGGYETTIFAFRLHAAPEAWSRPLILRILDSHVDSAVARGEVAAMRAARAQGYPAPEVLYSSPRVDQFGAPVIVMERLAGRTMMDELFPRGLPKIIPMLATLQARLHAADGAGIDADGIWRYADQLSSLRIRIDRGPLDGLREGLAWLETHAPAPARLVLCHGDFHPLNVLVDKGEVTGVIDWSLATMAEPEFDVANTRILLAYAPIDAGVFTSVAGVYQRLVLGRRFDDPRAYGRTYRRESDTSDEQYLQSLEPVPV